VRPLETHESRVVCEALFNCTHTPPPSVSSCVHAYLSFFFMRSCELWPHFFFLQFMALMGRRA
jgi:hypothetical protein